MPCTVHVDDFGTIEGKPIRRFSLASGQSTVRITNFGARVTELWLPDRNGKLADVVLGYDNLDAYVHDGSYVGAIVGRVANRIARATFCLDNKTYTLAANDGHHHLHGGQRGFDKVIWNAEAFQSSEGASVRLTYLSPDGEEGYPGSLRVTVVYTWTEDHVLRIDMEAVTDATTVINLASHTYWNLRGHDTGSVLNQMLSINASGRTPSDDQHIPVGSVVPVANTPFDFQAPKPVGRDVMHLPAKSSGEPGGYDHNYVVDGAPHELRPTASVYDPDSGRQMTLRANMPGVQLYTANHVNGLVGKRGACYGKNAALCLETQYFPNAINETSFLAPILQPGQTYRHRMVHSFCVR